MAPDRRSARRRWAIVALVAVAAALPYLPTLGAGTIAYDDPVYIDDQAYWREATLETLRDAVSRPIFANYNPLHTASYWLDRRVWGQTYVGLRVTQLALYVACACAVVALARRLAVPPAGVAAAGLVFAWHPSHVENVAWLSARKDLLFLLFLLLGLNTWLGPTPAPLADPGAPLPSARRRVAALALFALALASKGTAVIALPLLALVSLARRRLRADGPWLVLLLVLALGAIVLTSAAQEAFHVQAQPLPWGPRLERVVRGLAWYVSQAVLPITLSPRPPEPGPALDPAEVARLGLLGLTVVALGASWWRGARTPAVLGGWFFAALAPTSGLVPLPAYVHDRYLFAPSVALALGAGLLVAAAGRRWPRWRLSVCAAAGLVALGGLARATPYARAWCTSGDLWLWSVRVDPEATWALENLAWAMDPAESARAVALLEQLHRRDPTLVRPAFLLAHLLGRRGEHERARALIRSLAPYDRPSALLVADEALRAGDLEEAARWVEVAAGLGGLAPADVPSGRGRVAFARGDFAAAADHLRAAAEALPEWREVAVVRGIAARAAGRVDEAREVARGLPAAARRSLLAHLALDQGDEATAARLLAEAGPLDAEGELALARALARQGRRDEARAALARARAAEAGLWPPGRVELEVELRGLAE